MQFARRNHEHNFHVGVDCYFYSKIHGFHRAKQLAIGYRRRVEKEWEDLQCIWAKMDSEKALAKELANRVKSLESSSNLVSSV